MKSKNTIKYHRIRPLLEQLFEDIKAVPERLNMQITIDEVYKNDIESFCRANEDIKTYEKMFEHELSYEPVENIVIISQINGGKIEKKYFKKLLTDLGYNINVLFSKKNGSDFEAAINVNGYSIPGWKHLIRGLRKMDNNLASFLGKRFAPGVSRLHIRIFEGAKHWYIVAHIDEFNWTSFNLPGIKKSHVGQGAGNYTDGARCFLDSLEYYFGTNCKINRKEFKNFTIFFLPTGEVFFVPEDIDLHFPSKTKISTDKLHHLVYIPWKNDYLNYIPKPYQKFFQYVLPRLNIRTTDVHTARSLAFATELIKIIRVPLDEKIIFISLILHDIGWSLLSEEEIAASLGVRGAAISGVAENPKRKHTLLGEELAEKILQEFIFSTPLTAKEKSLILTAVLLHDSPEKISKSEGAPIEIKIICDADHLWSFTRQNFWQDTVRKKINPETYFQNLHEDIDKYFTTKEGKQKARELLHRRKTEVLEWQKIAKLEK